MLLPTVVLFALAFQLLQTDIPFYVHAVVGKHSWLGATLLLAVAIAAALACVPLFARLGRRTSKRRAYSLSMLAAAVTFPLLGIGGILPGIPATVQLIVVAALVGAPIGAHFLFPVPLTADVIDDDSATTELRREATYLGASSFVRANRDSGRSPARRAPAAARRHARAHARRPARRPARRADPRWPPTCSSEPTISPTTCPASEATTSEPVRTRAARGLERLGAVRTVLLALLLGAVISGFVYRSWVDAQARTLGVLALTGKVPVLAWVTRELTDTPRVGTVSSPAYRRRSTNPAAATAGRRSCS